MKKVRQVSDLTIKYEVDFSKEIFQTKLSKNEQIPLIILKLVLPFQGPWWICWLETN